MNLQQMAQLSYFSSNLDQIRSSGLVLNVKQLQGFFFAAEWSCLQSCCIATSHLRVTTNLQQSAQHSRFTSWLPSTLLRGAESLIK